MSAFFQVNVVLMVCLHIVAQVTQDEESQNRIPSDLIRYPDKTDEFRQETQQSPIGSRRKLLESLSLDSDWKLSDVGSNDFRQLVPIVGNNWIH